MILLATYKSLKTTFLLLLLFAGALKDQNKTTTNLLFQFDELSLQEAGLSNLDVLKEVSMRYRLEIVFELDGFSKLIVKIHHSDSEHDLLHHIRNKQVSDVFGKVWLVKELVEIRKNELELLSERTKSNWIAKGLWIRQP
jgi:hypothetical protein